MTIQKADLGKFIVALLRQQVTERGGFFSDGALDEDGAPTYPLVGINAEIDVEDLAQGILDRLGWEEGSRPSPS